MKVGCLAYDSAFSAFCMAFWELYAGLEGIMRLFLEESIVHHIL